MQDSFAIFSEPRRPLLDEESLKAKFHALTTEHHPDVATEKSDAFSAINLAYETLRQPRTRLKHLLELEAPELIARHLPAPESIGNLFPGMGERKLRLDAFLKKRATTSSALAKAMLMNEHLELQEDLEAWLGVLEAEKERWQGTLPALDAEWAEANGTGAPTSVAARIAEVAQALAYLDKWSAQVREGAVRLQVE